MMKKITSWAKMLIFVLVGALSLTSCDKDDMKAANLDGTWEGDFFMEYLSPSGILYHAKSTMIRFDQKPFKNYGVGYQIDYYPKGCPVLIAFHEFDWSVEDGIVTMVYPTEPELNIRIYDYRMSSTSFHGVIEKGASKTAFSLDKVEDPDWGEYSDRVGTYYYAKPRPAAEADSVSVE